MDLVPDNDVGERAYGEAAAAGDACFRSRRLVEGPEHRNMTTPQVLERGQKLSEWSPVRIGFFGPLQLVHAGEWTGIAASEGQGAIPEEPLAIDQVPDDLTN